MGTTLGLCSELGYSYDANAELFSNALDSDFDDFWTQVLTCAVPHFTFLKHWSASLPLISVNGLLAAVKPRLVRRCFPSKKGL